LKIDPKNEFAAASLGVIYVGKGKSEEARKYLSLSLNSNPKNLLALKWIAISYFNEGKIAEALNYLNKGYENYPDDVDFQRNLMICYYKLNDRSKTEKFVGLLSRTNNPIPAEIETYLKVRVQ
jgi:tetratricopeptide (TPR) repeat protein